MKCNKPILTLPLTVSECDEITMFCDLFTPADVSVAYLGQCWAAGAAAAAAQLLQPNYRTAQACCSGAVMMHDPYKQ